MTMTSILWEYVLPAFLLVFGLAVLNAVFQPPYFEDIDMLLYIAATVLIFACGSLAASTNYGVLAP